MSENKHTPGPWSARKAAHGPIDILAADGRDIVTLYGGGVDEAPADNARLIAAAPELLEALRKVEPLGDVSLYRDILKALRPHERDAFHDIIAGVRAAIAKAEGHP